MVLTCVCIHAYAISQYITSYITIQDTHQISRYVPLILTRRYIHRADNTNAHTPTPNTHNYPAPIPTLTYRHTYPIAACAVCVFTVIKFVNICQYPMCEVGKI